MEDGGAHWCVLIACLFTMNPEYNHIYSHASVYCYADMLMNLSRRGLVLPLKFTNELTQEMFSIATLP